MILRATLCPPQPWRNGLGFTREILAYPDSAEPIWRVSLAEITTDGPFSCFPGVDRTTLLLSGRGVTLSITGLPPVVLSRPYEMASYPGDTLTQARLADGGVQVLNIMVARRRATASCSVLDLTAPHAVEPADGPVLVWCLDGLVRHEDATIGPGEGFYGDHAQTLHGTATVLLAQFRSNRSVADR